IESSLHSKLICGIRPDRRSKFASRLMPKSSPHDKYSKTGRGRSAIQKTLTRGKLNARHLTSMGKIQGTAPAHVGYGKATNHLHLSVIQQGCCVKCAVSPHAAGGRESSAGWVEKFRGGNTVESAPAECVAARKKHGSVIQ